MARHRLGAAYLDCHGTPMGEEAIDGRTSPLRVVHQDRDRAPVERQRYRRVHEDEGASATIVGAESVDRVSLEKGERQGCGSFRGSSGLRRSRARVVRGRTHQHRGSFGTPGGLRDADFEICDGPALRRVLAAPGGELDAGRNREDLRQDGLEVLQPPHRVNEVIGRLPGPGHRRCTVGPADLPNGRELQSGVHLP
jgi:hypothetical protein